MITVSCYHVIMATLSCYHDNIIMVSYLCPWQRHTLEDEFVGKNCYTVNLVKWAVSFRKTACSAPKQNFAKRRVCFAKYLVFFHILQNPKWNEFRWKPNKEANFTKNSWNFKVCAKVPVQFVISNLDVEKFSDDVYRRGL
jgi:hypothetical protein